MSGTSQPHLLLLCQDAKAATRWQDILRPHFKVHVAQSVDHLEGMPDIEPSVCVVDIDLVAEDNAARLLTLRGLYAGAELIGVAKDPDVERLIASINKGHIRRFLALDAKAEDILEATHAVWRAGQSTGTLRRRLIELAEQRNQLLQEQQILLERMTQQDHTLAGAAQTQKQLRHRLDDSLRGDYAPSNCLTYAAMRVRIAEEIEKFHRYGHPLSLITILLVHEVSDEDERYRNCQALQREVAARVRHIDLVAAEQADTLLVLMPLTDEQHAQRVYHRIMATLKPEANKMQLTSSQTLTYPHNKADFMRHR